MRTPSPPGTVHHPRFAVYFIPPRSDTFYQAGSAILGYDSRTGQKVPKKEPRPFPSRWVAHSHRYGFHATVSPAQFFQIEQLPRIQDEIRSIWQSFSPHTQFLLTPAKPPIQFWGEHEEICVLEFSPSSQILMLHTALLVALSRFSLGSRSGATLRSPERLNALAPHERNKLSRFHGIHILDAYRPHFTLFNPLPHDLPTATVRRKLQDTFGRLSSIEVASLCLVVEREGSRYWELIEEYQK